MNSNNKLALLATFAAALLANPVSADAAQYKQEKHFRSYSSEAVVPYAERRTVIPAGTVYFLEDREFANSDPAVNFQDRFRIGY